MRFTVVISLVLAILAVLFALQNPGVTDVNILGLSYTGSKALILILTFAVGVLVGVLATAPAYIRNRRKVSSLKKTIAEDRTEARRERKTRPASSEHPTGSSERSSHKSSSRESSSRESSSREEEPPPSDESRS